MRIMAFQVCFMQCVSKIGFQPSRDRKWVGIWGAGWYCGVIIQTGGVFLHISPQVGHLSLDVLDRGSLDPILKLRYLLKNNSLDPLPICFHWHPGSFELFGISWWCIHVSQLNLCLDCHGSAPAHKSKW